MNQVTRCLSTQQETIYLAKAVGTQNIGSQEDERQLLLVFAHKALTWKGSLVFETWYVWPQPNVITQRLPDSREGASMIIVGIFVLPW